jgi:hypothetical protein
MTLTIEEYQARIDACFNPLPTPEEVVQWAKDNDYTFRCGTIGDAKCGCVLGALVMMRYPTALADAKEFASPLESGWNIFTGAIYGKAYTPSNRRPIYEGFDDLCDEDNPMHQYGKAVRKLAFGR